MTFIVMHRMANHERDPDVGRLPDLIAELGGDDAVVRYMRALPRDRALGLFCAVARGDLGEVEAQPRQRRE